MDKILITLCVILMSQSEDAAAATPSTILIIRHGEKTYKPDDIHLSKEGQERAEMLEQLFRKSETRPEPFPMPDFLFAAKNSKESQRPFETIAPLAKSLKLTIDRTFESKPEGAAQLKELIFKGKIYHGKVVLISWRHSSIPELAQAFGVQSPPKWADECFDRVWVLTFDQTGKASMIDKPQQLKPSDSTK